MGAVHEMMMDGKKVTFTDEQLNRNKMASKRIEVEVNGRRILIQEHMLDDAIKFGATRQKREVKPVPKELFVKEIPRSDIKPPVFTQIPFKPITLNPLPKMEEAKPKRKAK